MYSAQCILESLLEPEHLSAIRMKKQVFSDGIPLVTVVIPCFNAGKYLDEAVDSILNQSSKSYEIIIIDDGSTDSLTINKLKNYKKPRTIVIHTSNVGPAEARNIAIKQAQGKYILPLDADDKIGSDYLGSAIRILDRDETIGIVYCRGQYFGDRIGKYELPRFSINKILIKNVIFNSAVYRKSAWARVGGYKRNMTQGAEDYDFWLSLLELNIGVYQIPQVLYYYRVRGDSRTIFLMKHTEIYSNVMLQLYRNHKKLYIDAKRVNLLVRAFSRLRFSRVSLVFCESSYYKWLKIISKFVFELLLKITSIIK